jgi:xanthine/uracil permease
LGSGIGSMWKLHGDGRTVQPGEVVRPDERLNFPRMLGLGGQHVLAMFGATALVPVLTGFPVTTTIFFSGIGTIIFNLLTRNRVPSYTGSSFAFIAPALAAKSEGLEAALSGIVAAGIAMVTLVSILIIGVAVKNFLTRLSVLLGVVVGYVFAALLGDVNWDAVHAADWFGLPDFITPEFNGRAIVLIVPAVLLVLLAENAGHVKAVATMTEHDLDPYIGRSFMGDGVATTLSGLFGGSGTTTYAENIGVMGYTRVYSTLAYLIAGVVAIALGLLPKFGAIISAIPVGVLGGAVTVLFGMIAVLGARIWIEANVNFRDPVNLVTAAVALIVGTANYTLNWGDYSFAGIALGTIAAIVIYQVLRFFQPELPEPGTGIGDSLTEPLAAAPARRGPAPER